MRKSTMSVLTILVLLALPLIVTASTPGGPFSSAFRVQNLSASIANCVYTFYNSSGTAQFTSASSAINPGDSLFVYVPSLSLANGEYSGVVSCDQDVAAVVNWSDANSGASFEGVGSTDTATTLYAPGIYDNYFNFYSNVYVQNASTGPVNVTVSIYAPGNSSPVATQVFNSLPANASHLFEQSGLSQLANNVPYSAKITATGSVAAIVNIYGGVGTVADNQLYSYNAFKGGSKKAYAPVLMNNYFGYNTALAIQNLSSTSSTTYTISYGTGQVQNGSIPANSSVSLYTPSAGVPAGSLTSATVSAGQDVVVLVNESNSFRRAASYAGFAAGNTVGRAPIVMRNYFNFDSSVTCQNVGTASATMSIDYANTGTNTTSPSILPGKTHLFYQPSDPNMLPGITSATITSSQPIACIVNQDTTSALATVQADNLYAYEGITR